MTSGKRTSLGLMTHGCRIVLLLLLAHPGLQALEWNDGAGVRWLTVKPSASDRDGFHLLAPSATGITFTNHLSDRRSITNRNLLSGSGVALGDVDGDGLCDIYFAALESGGRLYRNLGEFRFEDMTEKAGVGCPGQASTGAVLADTDGDGDLDLLVSSFGRGVRLFKNKGGWMFQETTGDAGLASDLGSTSMALADIDGDSDLDLYVANFRPHTIMDQPDAQFRLAMQGAACGAEHERSPCFGSGSDQSIHRGRHESGDGTWTGGWALSKRRDRQI